jgi:hypothetical protein
MQGLTIGEREQQDDEGGRRAGMDHELVEHIELRHLFENLDKAGIALIAREK